MNTNLLKRFATEARNILMLGVRNRLQTLGFDLTSGQPSDMPQEIEGGATFMGDTVSMDFYHRWMSLYHNVCARGIKAVAEEAAYTWFNRFIAIRFMQKQGFISPVLAYESEEGRVPVIVSEARQGRMPQMADDVREKLIELLDDDGKTNEQFALLIVAYCHENPIINQCFGRITDYTELLLPQNILVEGGFVSMLNRMSSERNDELAQSLPSREGGRPEVNQLSDERDEDFRSAELIGWLYQFYISDRKAEAFAKKGKYDADEIAPATQIFTPNWIVKYMVENTVGRIYVDNNPDCEVKDHLNYLVDAPTADGGDTLHLDDIAELTVADLACGSGHILNECFDLLYSIYVNEEFYSRTQAITNILRKNILGIDLDTRAKQLATFALLMKACQKDTAFLDGRVMPRIYDMPRPLAEVIAAEGDARTAEDFLRDVLPHYLLGGNSDMVKELTDAILLMNHAGTLGSIMQFDLTEPTRNAIMVRTEEYEELLAKGEVVPSAIRLLLPYMRIILALTQQYAALCMNPPYMGSGRFDTVLSKYVKKHYEEGKADLATVFVDMMGQRTVPNGKYAFIIPPSWMFLSTFEGLRKDIIENKSIESLLHLSRGVFGADFGASSAIIKNTRDENACGIYFRLVERTFQEFDQKHLRMLFEQTLANHDFKYRFKDYTKDDTELPYADDGNRIYYPNVAQKNFEKIPGEPIGYWVSEKIIGAFQHDNIGEKAQVVIGIKTGDNGLFIRNWYEINYRNTDFSCRNLTDFNASHKKWFPYVKGGEYRLWYGNQEQVLYWDENGDNMLSHTNKQGLKDARVRQSNFPLYGNDFLSWSRISSLKLGIRYVPQGILFDCNSPSIFQKGIEIKYILGFLASKVSHSILKFIAPTLSFQIQDIKSIPLIIRLYRYCPWMRGHTANQNILIQRKR